MDKKTIGVGLFIGACLIAIMSDTQEKLTGGLGDHRDDDEFDEDELEMGDEVEMEHTDDPEVAHEIAKDHLSEDDHYYTHLKDIETPQRSANKKI